MNTTWKNGFSKAIAIKIGFYIDPERVIEAKRRSIYLPEATEGHPTVLCCRDGMLTVDVPKEDYLRLEHEEISIEDYIDKSFWLYGFFAGLTANIMEGAFITPLERAPGIHDKDKIWRFLKIMFCNMEHVKDSFLPTIRACSKCSVRHCPVSRYKGNFGNFANEPGMVDSRWDLLAAISNRVHTDFGYLINRIYPIEDLDDNEMILTSYDRHDSFNVYVSDSLIRNILYYPKKNFEFADIVRVMNVRLKKNFDDNGVFVFNAQQFHTALEKFEIEESWD